MNDPNFADPAELANLLHGMEWVDLSHTLEEGIPVWPTHPRFAHTLYESYDLGDDACHYGLSIGEHTGTHMDATLHFISEGPAKHAVDEIPLPRLAGRAATIQATDLRAGDLLTVEHVRDWERQNGTIQADDRVLIRYGWDNLWATGASGRGFLEPWPGLSEEAARYLADRRVAVVGCDTLAIDATHSRGNPAHYALLGSETYIVENLKNLDLLPAFCFFMAFPLKIREGSGSPVRATALIPGGDTSRTAGR